MISLCFVYFRTLNLQHLDAAWYSVSRQDFTDVNEIVFLDNNTPETPEAILDVLARYPMPVPVRHRFAKHGDSTKTQSWSVNEACGRAEQPWIFFTRADYILAFDAVARMWQAVQGGEKLFISGWCWQMAYDRDARNVDANIDIEQYHWRELGMPALLQHPYAFRFHETDQDAGVWLTQKAYMQEAGWMNEQLTSWGYQQSEWQRRLRAVGVSCRSIQDYLFAHQHHYAERDFDKARDEWAKYSGR